MKCFAGGRGAAIRTVCGISFLLPQSSADIPPDLIHPASQIVSLTHSCYRVLWFRLHSAHPVLNSGSRHVQLPRLKQSLRTVRRRGRVGISGHPTRLTQLLTALLRGRATGVSGPSLIRIHGRPHWVGGIASHGTSRRQDTENLRSQAHIATAGPGRRPSIWTPLAGHRRWRQGVLPAALPALMPSVPFCEHSKGKTGGLARQPSGIQVVMWQLLFSSHLTPYHCFPPSQVFHHLARPLSKPITPLTTLNNRQGRTRGVELSVCSRLKFWG